MTELDRLEEVFREHEDYAHDIGNVCSLTDCDRELVHAYPELRAELVRLREENARIYASLRAYAKAQPAPTYKEVPNADA